MIPQRNDERMLAFRESLRTMRAIQLAPVPLGESRSLTTHERHDHRIITIGCVSGFSISCGPLKPGDARALLELLARILNTPGHDPH